MIKSFVKELIRPMSIKIYLLLRALVTTGHHWTPHLEQRVEDLFEDEEPLKFQSNLIFKYLSNKNQQKNTEKTEFRNNFLSTLN